jgi:hypothetical protein
MFAIKSGQVMEPNQVHFRHETVIGRDIICQTEIATILVSWVAKSASVKMSCPQNCLPLFFYALCLLINVCVYCRCETNFGTLYIQLPSTACSGEKQELASLCLSFRPHVCLSVRMEQIGYHWIKSDI